MGNQTIYDRLKRHFQADPGRLPVVASHFQTYERPNLHLAIDHILQSDGRKFDLFGVVEYDYGITLSRLALERAKQDFFEGPVQYQDVAVAHREKLACVKQGLYLITAGDGRFAMLVADSEHRYPPVVKVEVMAGDREQGESLLRNLVSRTRQSQAFRGQVLSLDLDCYRQISIEFHELPAVARDAVILPEAVLSRIERHTIDFSRQSSRMRQAGRHLKRGILLHGPPGTGKTLTAMHLASRMPDRTVLVMTGRGMGSIETACRLARLLEPSTVVLEDVDLIGTERHMQTVGANALLFELLNQMDGLADDRDVLFILTTNRPDILEPALASRPGRIDQAIEIPLPDAQCRRRLLELYGQGLQVEPSASSNLVERTEGVSAAFIRELLRKAAVLAAIESDGEELVVRSAHLTEALEELLVAGGELTKSLLGVASTRSGEHAPQ